MKDKATEMAVKAWGVKHQELKAVEELTELARAVLEGNRKGVLEEIADVLVMIDQLAYIHGLSDDDVFEAKFGKLRLLEIRADERMRLGPVAPGSLRGGSQIDETRV